MAEQLVTKITQITVPVTFETVELENLNDAVVYFGSESNVMQVINAHIQRVEKSEVRRRVHEEFVTFPVMKTQHHLKCNV